MCGWLEHKLHDLSWYQNLTPNSTRRKMEREKGTPEEKNNRQRKKRTTTVHRTRGRKKNLQRYNAMKDVCEQKEENQQEKPKIVRQKQQRVKNTYIERSKARQT